MMWLRGLVAIVFGSVLIGCASNKTAVESPGIRHEDPVAAMRETQAKLQVPMTVDYDNAPLERVLAEINAATDAQFEVEWWEFEKLAVNRDRPVTLKKTDRPAAEVLDAVLRQVSADLGIDDGLEIGFDGSRMIVSSRAAAQSFGRYVAVYDVNDLYTPAGVDMLVRLEQFRLQLEAEKLDPTLVPRKDPEELFDFDDDEDRGPLYDPIPWTMDLLQDMTGDPMQWLDEGYTINEIRGLLVVRTTPLVHAEIRELFALARDQQATPEVIEARLTASMVRNHLLNAEAFRQTGQWDEALEHVEVALRLDRDNALAPKLKQLIEKSRPAATRPAEWIFGRRFDTARLARP